MRPHDLDVVSLLAGMVFLVLGAVGLLQGAGIIGTGAPWALIAAVATVGVAGLAISLHRLRAEPAAETSSGGGQLDVPSCPPPEEAVPPLDDPEELDDPAAPGSLGH